MSKPVTRQQLIEQATLLFRMKGYAATSIGEIVQACGITKGSLYHHFPGKEALGLATIEQLEQYYDQHLFSLINPRQPAASLAAFNQAVEDFFLRHPNGCLLANLSLEMSSGDEPFKQKILDFFARWQEGYQQIFSVFYPAAQAKILAEDALATVQGCILMYRITGKIESLQRQHQILLSHCA
ncbi:MAG: TetR/AcrR family transcriptional regulator [Iodobacter sp.]